MSTLAIVAAAALQLAAVARAAKFHFGVGVGLRPGRMGDPQLYWDAPTQRFHIQPQYTPVAAMDPANQSACRPRRAPGAGWGHATSSDLIGDFNELPSTFGACADSKLDMYSSAGTGCSLRLNDTHVGSLVNGDTSVGWETTNNYAAVVDSTSDAVLKAWTQVSHGIEGNHSVGEHGWIGTPGNHIPAPFGLIGNVIAFHNSTAQNMVAVVSSSVGNPRLASSLPAFIVYTSTDFASWTYSHPLYTHPTPMNRAECGDFFPIGPGAEGVTAANVDFGKATANTAWVLMWSRPARNGGGQSRASGVVYFVGKFEGNGTFTPTSPLQAADYGAGFYASQTVLGPGDERVIMADLGGGIQSLPRAITLNPDQSLDFQPAAALAQHYVGAPFVLKEATVAAGAQQALDIPASFFDALDLTVTFGMAATGGIVLRGGLALTLDAAAFPTGHGKHMRTLNIAAARFHSSIAVAETFRIVVDETTVEIFGGATPASFVWKSTNASAALIGPGTFDVTARQIAPAKITSVF